MPVVNREVFEAISEQGGITRESEGKYLSFCPVCHNRTRYLRWTLGEKGFEVYADCGCSAGLVAALERAAFEPEAPAVVPTPVNGAEPQGPFVVPSLGRNEELSQYDPPRDVAREARHGIAGRILDALEEHTEASASGLLASFLVGAGNLMGRRPHFWIEGARQGTNLYGVLVGVSSSGRKGTASNRIEEVINSIDCNWTKNIVRGLSSGEGLVHAVRDPRIEPVPVKKAGRFTGEIDDVMVDRGVEDKRCLVREEEFANVLRVMGREGNTLSIVVRNAWDNKRLGALTKTNKESATDPHISILGHITEVELKRHLTETEAGNGFANRFLWVCTHRARLLPRGGGRPNMAPFTWEMHDLWQTASQFDEIGFDEGSGMVWDAIYKDLSERHPGLLGAVTSRAEAQVLRLSVLYAVLDGENTIRLPHLLAALAFWDFCEKSAAYIFGRATGDDYADIIEEALGENESLTRTEIRDKFGRNALPGRIPKALASLKASGRAEFRRLDTGGRPMEIWSLTANAAQEKSDKGIGNNLARARKAASLLLTT